MPNRHTTKTMSSAAEMCAITWTGGSRQSKHTARGLNNVIGNEKPRRESPRNLLPSGARHPSRQTQRPACAHLFHDNRAFPYSGAAQPRGSPTANTVRFCAGDLIFRVFLGVEIAYATPIAPLSGPPKGSHPSRPVAAIRLYMRAILELRLVAFATHPLASGHRVGHPRLCRGGGWSAPRHVRSMAREPIGRRSPFPFSASVASPR